LRPGRRVQHLVNGRNRPIVKVRGSRPYSVQRRGLVTTSIRHEKRPAVEAGLASKPAVVEVADVALRERLGQARVGADLGQWDDLVRVGPALAVGAMTPGTMVRKQRAT